MDITIQTTETLCKAYTPYSPAFVSAAKKRGAKWSPSDKCWVFDAAAEASVRELCREIYGTDGSPTETVTLRVELTTVDGQAIECAGRTLAYRAGRDYPVRIGEGVSCIDGGFPKSGGSMKNPRCNPEEGTVLLVREVPKAKADAVIADSLRGMVVTLAEEIQPVPQWDLSAIPTEVLRAELAARDARAAR